MHHQPLRFSGGHKEFGITLSIGMVMVTQEDGSFDEAMARADQALYLAKARGRDRVEGIDEPRLALVGGGRDRSAIEDSAGNP